MKKTQFRIGLLTACLIGANSAFCNIASAQSCGAESCDSKSCKCSKKQCDDSGLLDVINSAASNFEAGLASMIPDGQKQKAKPSCECSKCSAASERSQAVPMVPPTIHEKEHVHSHAPHTPAPLNPIHSPIPTPIPAPAPAPVPDSHSNPFRDDTTRNQRTLPSRPASLLRQKNSNSPIEYDPQARTQPTMRSNSLSNSLSLVATKSVSDLPDGLATTKSTRRVLAAPVGYASNNQLVANQAAANQLRGNLQSDGESAFESHAESNALAVQSLDHVAPAVVPASSTVPLRKLQELQPPIEATNANRLPAAATSEMYVNPLRAQ